VKQMENDDEKIIEQIQKFLEEKKGLTVTECLRISKKLFDEYFDDLDFDQEEGDLENEDIDEFGEFEEEQENEIESVNNQIEPEEKERVAEPGDYDFEPKKTQKESVNQPLREPLTIKKNMIPIKNTPVAREGYVQESITNQDIDDGDF